MEDLRGAASSICERLSRKPTIESDLVRDAFTTTCVDPIVTVLGHTHAEAAGCRTAATAFVMNVAQYCGASVFIVGMSRSDQRKNYRGTRQWFWSKDANATNRNDNPKQDDIRYMCDVDYYVDMPNLLAEEAKPLLLYTMVPESAAQTGVDNTAYRFMEDGSLQTTVAGGGAYQHYIWNYGMDSVMVTRYVFGIPWTSIAYSIERKQVSRNRQLILFAPMREFYGLGCWLSLFLLETSKLTRFNPVVSTPDTKFIRFDVLKPNGEAYVTTAVAGSFLCADVSVEVDECIATVANLGTTNLMLPTTASWIKDNRSAAAVLTRYHRATCTRSKLTVFPVEKSVRSYQYKPDEYDQDARVKVEAFMSPLVHEAFVPVPNKAGEEQCVEGRVNGLRKPDPKPCKFRDRCIDEFAELVVQGAVLEPVCYEVVADKQTRASQVVSLIRAVVTGWYRKLVLKCHIKGEVYPGVKDPRNISTYNDADKLDMSMFALALSEHMKQYQWYGPGKTPLELATRVSEICSNAESYVNISDFHRMDGTISYVLRQVDRAIMMKIFANHRAKVNEILKTNVDNTGFLPNGTTFEQGPSHGSGCAATSLFQTNRAAFCAYLALRHQRMPSGRYRTPAEAFAAIGIHLGDDGLDAGLPTADHEWSAKRLGLVLEAATVQRGFRGVNFLARYYSSNVWYGDTNSMCDIKRQLSKFHTTIRMPKDVAPEHKLVEKCLSYVATDGNTPILGPFCKRVLLLSPYRPKALRGIGNWWSKFEASVQYPNENVDGWMDDECIAQFEEFDRGQFTDWLVNTQTSAELLRAPVCAEPKAPQPTVVDVVVDGDVLPAKVSIADPPVGTPPTTSTPVPSRRTPRVPREARARAPTVVRRVRKQQQRT